MNINHSIKYFQNQVVYQVYVRSFYDANGDGIGDIKGVTEKLPYLSSLGIGYLWLSPVFPSPQCDNGYDVSDYCAVDPMFGTMDDLEELIQKTAELNIGIILDMVFNHTSTEHIWFQKALAGDQYYQDFYFFRSGKSKDQPPSNWISKFGGSAWQQLPDSEQYYLHLFSSGQADLNWANPNVKHELYQVLRFWIDKGIKGFRFDVINLISKPEQFEDDFEGDGRRFYTDGPKVESYLKEIYQIINEGREAGDEILTVGELSSTTPQKCIPYCQEGNQELSMVFHFQHLKVDYPDNNSKWTLCEPDFPALKSILHSWQTDMNRNNAWDALFWNNHDQPRALTRFASNKKEYRYESAALLASTIHFMRGIPYVYGGEEIGMINPEFEDISQYRDIETLNYYQILLAQGLSPSEVMKIIKARSRDNSRTPMQWNTGQNAGFTVAVPWINAADNKSFINVEAEENNATGILAFYRTLISLRKELTIIQTGTYKPILETIDKMIAYERENEVQYLICFNNYSEQTIQIPSHLLLSYQSLSGKVLLSNYHYETKDFDCFDGQMVLRPYETIALLLDKN